MTHEQMRAKLEAALPKYDENGLGEPLPWRPLVWKISFSIACAVLLFFPVALFDSTREVFRGSTGAWDIVSALGAYALFAFALEQVVDGFINKIWRRGSAPRMVSSRRTRKTRYRVFAVVSVLVIALGWWLQ